MIDFYKYFEIKKFTFFICMNLMSFFLFSFFKVSNLFSVYYLIYSFGLLNKFLNIEYSLGLDNLGFTFILLTVFLIPVCLIISWKNITYGLKYFFILFLILEVLLINVFLAVDLMVFYFAFESILIPMYILVGYWGSRERRCMLHFNFFYIL